MFYQDAEFIAAEPRQRVPPAHRGGQQFAELFQHGVAGHMAAGVVDDLEVIEVEIAGRMTAPGLQQALQTPLEFTPVYQPRERVMGGLVFQLLREALVFGDVIADDQDLLPVIDVDDMGRLPRPDNPTTLVLLADFPAKHGIRAVEAFVEPLPARRPVFVKDERVDQVPADQFIGLVAEIFGAKLVDRDDPALIVQAEEYGGRVIIERAEFSTAFPQFFSVPFLLNDRTQDRGNAE